MLAPFQVTFPGVGPVLFTSFDDLARAEINAALSLWRETLETVRPADAACAQSVGWDRAAKQLLATYRAEIAAGTRAGLPTPGQFFSEIEALVAEDEDVVAGRGDFSERFAATRVDTGALVACLMVYDVRADRVDPGTARDRRVTAQLSPHMPNMGTLAWARRTANFIAFVLDRPMAFSDGIRTVTLTAWRFPLDPLGVKLWAWPGRATFITELQSRGLTVDFRDVGGTPQLAAVHR